MVSQVAVGGRVKAVGYLRRSTDRQEQSIPDQRKAVEAFAAARGLRIDHFYIDDAISGTSTVGRRAFQQMVADAQRPDRPFSAIVVYDVKRFGRVDNDEAGYWRHVLKLHGVEVLYASENFGGDGTDDLLRPVKQWQAREESKDLSKVTIRGLLSKADGGWWMGGVPPHGYDLRYETAEGKFLFVLRHLPDGTKRLFDEGGTPARALGRGESLSVSKRDRARLVPGDPDRVAAVREIFRLYVEEGRGYAAVADALNRRGVPTPRGPGWAGIYSGRWTDTTVRAILINPLYCGDMVWNRRTDGRFHRIEQGRAVPRQKVHAARLEPNDPAQWLIVRDAHEPLVDRRTFELARRSREARPTAAGQRQQGGRAGGGGAWHGTRSRFVLSGLLTCARCGSRYQGLTRQKGKKRVDGTPVKTFYYGCGGYITKGRSVCELGAVRQEVLERAVFDAVLAHYRPYLEAAGGRTRLAEVVRKRLGGEGEDLTAARRRLDEERARVKGTADNLLDNITPGNRAFVDQRLAELAAQREALDARAEQLEALAVSQRQVRAATGDALAFLRDLEHALREGLPEQQRAALRRCVARVTVDGGDQTAKVAVNDVPCEIGDSRGATASDCIVRLPG